MAVFNGCFRLETLFLGKFGSKNENCQFQLKFDTYSNSNMKSSMVMLTLFFLNDTPFYGKFFQKIKILCWSCNLEPWLIWICKSWWWCSFFYFRPFLEVLFKKCIWHFYVTWLISQQVINFTTILKRRHFFLLNVNQFFTYKTQVD